MPYLTPRLSSYWVDLVTPVDRRVSHALIDSLVTEVVVRDGARTRERRSASPRCRSMPRSAKPSTINCRPRWNTTCSARPGLRDGVYTARVVSPRGPHAASPAEPVATDLAAIGGDYHWYGVAALWRVRVLAGRLFGERLRLGRPPVGDPEAGDDVDWWTVVRRSERELVLRGRAGSPATHCSATVSTPRRWCWWARCARGRAGIPVLEVAAAGARPRVPGHGPAPRPPAHTINCGRAGALVGRAGGTRGTAGGGTGPCCYAALLR